MHSSHSYTPLSSIGQRMYSYHGSFIVSVAVTVVVGTGMDERCCHHPAPLKSMFVISIIDNSVVCWKLHCQKRENLHEFRRKCVVVTVVSLGFIN